MKRRVWFIFGIILVLLASTSVTYAQGPRPSAACGPAPAPWPSGCVQCVKPSGEITLMCTPAAWNTQLVVYAHGYVPAQAPLALPAKELILPDGTNVPQLVMNLGYAFATTSYRKNGYAVEQGGQDINALVDDFKLHVQPSVVSKVLIVGASEGGLITTMLVERYPQTYAGGLAACGPLAGGRYQAAYLGDFRVVFDYFYRVFPFSAFGVPPNAYQAWDTTWAPAIEAAIRSDAQKTNQLFRVTDAPRDPSDPANSAVVSAKEILWYSIWATQDILNTTGGIPYDNRTTWYFGSANDWALNRGVERVTGTPAALAYLDQYYRPTGRLDRPLVTIHTTVDPVVPYRHELIYMQRATEQGRFGNLTVVTIPRCGHCNFTAQELLAAFAILALRTAN